MADIKWRIVAQLFLIILAQRLLAQTPTTISSVTLTPNDLVGGSTSVVHGTVTIQRGTSFDGKTQEGNVGYVVPTGGSTIVAYQKFSCDFQIAAAGGGFQCAVPAGATSANFSFVPSVVPDDITLPVVVHLGDGGGFLLPGQLFTTFVTVRAQRMTLALSPSAIPDGTPTLVRATASFLAPPAPNTWDSTLPSTSLDPVFAPFNFITGMRLEMLGSTSHVDLSSEFVTLPFFGIPPFTLLSGVAGPDQLSKEFTVTAHGVTQIPFRVSFPVIERFCIGCLLTADATLAVTQAVPLLEALTVVPGQDDEFISTSDAKAREAHFALGSSFQINLWMPQPDGSRTGIPASFTLDQTPTFANKLNPDPMFPHNVVFPYLPQSLDSGMVFQATHEGTQMLTITPVDSSIAPITLKLVVETAQSLGSAHNDLDIGILSLADSTGVPPEMIKGQIDAEGLFNPFTFRYEPINADVGDLAVSRGRDLRTRDPYAKFRVPTIGDSIDPGNCNPFPDVNLGIPDVGCPGLSLGSSFSQHEMDTITGPHQDFHLRTWQRDSQTGQLVFVNHQRVVRRLSAGDRYVSALDVFQASDPIFHFTRWSPARRASRLSFTGEFPLAGSYGFLQMTYVTAIGELHWKGTNPPCDGASDPLDPSGLYDTTCNLQNGGGSLGLGTTKVKNAFIANYGSTPSIDGVVAFNDRLAGAYQLYNRRKPHYGEDVVRRSSKYGPNSSRKIFGPGGQ